jgi:hypothetical protein
MFFSLCFADMASALHFHLSGVDSFGREIRCSSEYLNEELNDVAEEVRCYQRDSEIFYTRNLVNRTVEDEVEADVMKGNGYTYELGKFKEVSGVDTKVVNVSGELGPYADFAGTFKDNYTIQLYNQGGTTIVTVYVVASQTPY